MRPIRFFLTVFTAAIILSCNNNAGKKDIEADTTQSIPSSAWVSSLNDSTGRLEMKKSEAGGPDSLTTGSVIRYLNEQNPNVQLEISKTSHDTLFIKIPNPTYLTQQMGSTGPTMFLSAAVYNLTEIPGIRYVNFDFEEGDHASPGTFSRESFKDE